MTTEDIHAADVRTLHEAINRALTKPPADFRKLVPRLPHADLLDECERRWGVEIAAHPHYGEPGWWASATCDHGERKLAQLRDEAPARRLAELRALALALQQMGVLT